MNTQTATQRLPARSTAAILLEFLGSMTLAITLLVALAIASVIGTVLQQNQPYTDYLIKFGPFWHEVFKTLGLYDVYSAGWFLTILGFLVISTSVCIYRHAPTMLRDMRRLRVDVQAKSLRAFHHVEERSVPLPPERMETLAARLFTANGYRVRVKDQGDHRVVSAMKGGSNRLGYLLTHVAIVVICIGGLMDGKLPIKIAEMTGKLRAETRNIPASEVPAISQVGTNNFSFRGSVDIPEGSRANLVFLPLRDGYLVQHLPFAVEVKDFRVEHWSTGAPKSFESDLVIYDDDLPKPLEATIAVNHPLVYKGFSIYQSSFGDGGSHLALRLWPLDTDKGEAQTLQGEVFQQYPLETSDGPMRLEITDFRLFNINPVQNAEGKIEQHNMGPSFTYKLRDQAGAATEFVNYMNPVEQDGRYFFVSGMRTAASEDFRYLHIPMDSAGGVERFMRFLTYIQNPDLVHAVALETTRRAMGQAQLQGADMESQVANSMARLVLSYARGGFDAIVHDVEQNIAPEQQQEAAEAFMRVLQTGLQGVYRRVLADEGVENPGDSDWQFFEDAVAAVAALPVYGTPYYIQLSQFRQVEASGLQISRSPGKNVVYLGSLMLVAGVFLLFYMAHRRLWVWVAPEGEGSRVIFAGATNRNVSDFDTQFNTLAERLRDASAASRSDEPRAGD